MSAVVPLIEKRAGLLAAPGRGEKANAVLVHFDLVRHLAAQQLDAHRQPFLGAQRDVVAGEDSQRLHELLAARRRSSSRNASRPALMSWTTSQRVVAIADE